MDKYVCPRTLINAFVFIIANPEDLTKREPVYSKYLNSDAHIYQFLLNEYFPALCR